MISWIRTHPFITAAFLVAGALLTVGFWPEPEKVELASVARGPLQIFIEEEGRTRVKDRYVIAAPVDGVTCRVELEVGDPVAQGEVLLQISPLESQVLDARSRARAGAALAAAEAALLAAQEQARGASSASNLARSELARLEPLAEHGVISRERLERARSEAERAAAARQSANFRVDVARYEVEAARAVLEQGNTSEGEGIRVPVASPIDGRILDIEHECQGPVRTGEPLLEVGDPTALEVEVELLSADAVRVEPGMQVWLDRWGGDQPLEARVRNIEPVGFTKISALGVEEQRVRVVADLVSAPEQWQRLGDGYRVEARFVVWQTDDALQVPASSLFRTSEGWAVFRVDEGVARLQPVELGHHSGLAAEVLSGLDEGDQLVIYPSDAISDGQRVEAWVD